MDQVSAGRVVFDGRDLAALKESELAPIRLEKMGFVFQNPQLLKNLSLFDNIILPGLVAKKEPAAGKPTAEPAMNGSWSSGCVLSDCDSSRQRYPHGEAGKKSEKNQKNIDRLVTASYTKASGH